MIFKGSIPSITTTKPFLETEAAFWFLFLSLLLFFPHAGSALIYLRYKSYCR